MGSAGLVRERAGGLRLPAWLRDALAAESAFWAVLLAAVPLLAAGLALLLSPVDPDYWWHLATGRWMLDHQRVPRSDPFSWTHGGQSWVAHEWLAELILALTDRAGGYAAALLLTLALALAGFWLLLAAGRCYGLSRRALCLLMLLWGGIPLRSVAVRPQVWGWALLCALLYLLAAYETGRRRTLWALPPLFALWINLHLSAFIGLGCLGVFAVGRVLRRRPDRHLLLVCLLSGAALLLNPWGLGLLRFALTYAHPDALRYQMIDEWHRPSLRDPTLIPFWLAAPMAVAAAWFALRRRALWPGVAVVALFLASLRAQRSTPVYGLLLIPFAGWLWWSGRRRPREVEAISAAGNRLLPRGRTLALTLAGALTVLALAALLPIAQFRRTPDPRGYPAAAAAVLAQRSPGTRLFNTYGWGGYLIARLWPDAQVYVDGREEMYGDGFLRHFLDLDSGDADASAILMREGVTAVLVERRAGIAARLARDPAWTVAYEDRASILFLRASDSDGR